MTVEEEKGEVDGRTESEWGNRKKADVTLFI